MSDRTVYQPLHPSLRNRLDPDYVVLHDTVLQYVPRSESLPFDPVASRAAVSPMAHGSQKIVEVGRTEDRTIFEDPADGSTITVRIFVPAGTPPAPPEGWPLLVWYHGGGWVMGGLSSENGFLTHVCKYLECVVISVNYRHAPEHVYPAAFDDAFVGYQWAVSPATVAELHLDTSRVAVGGLSAGGGLTASISMKIAEARATTTTTPSLPAPCCQVLICPVIDNTVTVDTDPAERAGWKESQHAPWLTPTRMQWYRDMYFGTTDTASTAQWQASPCYAPAALLAASPPTFVGIAGCDLLGPEAAAYGKQLAAAGVAVDAKTYPGGTHSILVLAGIHKRARAIVHDACAALAKAWGRTYSAEASPVLGQDE